MNHKMQRRLKMSERVNKAIKGCDPSTFEVTDWNECNWIESLDHYTLTAFDTETGRKFIKRLSGPITTCMPGTDGWHIDITRKALLEFLYCPKADCGLTLGGSQRMNVDVYHDSISVSFEWRD